MSLLLAKDKIPHVLIDKETFPRAKICGDGFTIEVLRTLGETDEDLFQEFINAEWTKASYGMHTELKNRKSIN